MLAVGRKFKFTRYNSLLLGMAKIVRTENVMLAKV